jgi:hypothetical protein
LHDCLSSLDARHLESDLPKQLGRLHTDERSR